MEKWILPVLLLTLISPLEGRAGDAPDQKPGLTFPISYTGEGFGNLSGGYRQGAVYDAVLNVGIQGDLDKLVGWSGGSFLVSGLYPHGASLTEKYVHDFNGVSNIDTYDSLRLYEAWLEQEAGGFSVRAGQLLADTEFCLSENGANFINSAFGSIPLIARNFRAPVYPVAGPGVRVRWKAGETFSVQAGLYDGDVGDPVGNPHGLDWSLNTRQGALALAEAAWTPWKDGGTYKLGAFYHTPAENDALLEKGRISNAGGYVIADQPLWREPGSKDAGLNAFLRIGGAPAERSVVPFYGEAGLTRKGPFPGREGDIAGIGFSFTRVSSALRDAAGEPPEAHHEAVLEATYKIKVSEWLTVQPDIQYLFNPGAAIHQDNALAVGLQFAFVF
ncbi:MAG: carbohydrate porin [Chthoniobacteraceae bacterium]